MTGLRGRPNVLRRAGDRPGLLVLLVSAAALATSVAAIWNFVVVPITGTFGGPFEDFAAYAQAAHAVVSGTSPYAGFDPRTIVMSGFDYPPFAAVALRPLAALSAHWQQAVWLAIALASLVGGAVLTARTLLPRAWPRARIGIVVALTFPPATYNLWHGQMNTVIFLLLSIALADYVGGRRTRCGAVLGLAAGIKLAPIVLLVVLARRGWWRGVAAGVATAAATALVGIAALGWPVTRQYLGTVLPVLDRDNGWIYNQTWNGVANRLAGHSVLAVGQPSPWPHLVATLLSLATVTVLVAVVQPGTRVAGQRGVEFACGVLAMLLVGTVAWYPVYVHLLIALAAGAGFAYSNRRGRGVVGGWTLAAYIGVGAVGGAAISALSMTTIGAISTGPLWWVFLQACSLPALLAAGLLVTIARALRRTAARNPDVRGAALAR